VQDLGFLVSSAKSASGKPLYVSARNGEEIGRENREVAVVPGMESTAFAASVGETDAAALAWSPQRSLLRLGKQMQLPERRGAGFGAPHGSVYIKQTASMQEDRTDKAWGPRAAEILRAMACCCDFYEKSLIHARELNCGPAM
jgi:hypothetical protein